MAEASGKGSTITHRAAHAAWWSALEISARYGIQFAVTIMLARLLAPSDFGLIAMLLVFTAIAALLVDGGFSTALVQQQRRSDDDETTVFISSLAAGLGLGLALWLGAPLVAAFYSQPALTPLTRVVLFVLPLAALAAVPDALLTQRLDFRARTKAEVVASVCSGAVAVVLAMRGFGVWSLACQAIVAIGLRAMLLWWYSRWLPRGRFRAESFRRLFAFGGYMLMSNLIATLYMRLQSLMIGRLFDSRALGYYTLAQNTQQAPAQFMGNLLNRVGLPVFSMVSHQPAKLTGALRMSLRAALFAFIPCMVGIAVVADPLIAMLYGPRWAPAAPLLAILAVSAAFWPMQVLNMAAISAKGRSDLVFRLELAKRAVSIALVLACSPFGPMAIAWAVLVASLVAVAINTWYTHKLLGYGLLAQLRDQAATLLLSALAALAGWLVLHWLPSGAGPMVAAIALAATVYVAGAALLRHPALADVLDLARTLRARGPRSGTGGVDP
jgi:O-antigen/teichoic acid export membrane protein